MAVVSFASFITQKCCSKASLKTAVFGNTCAYCLLLVVSNTEATNPSGRNIFSEGFSKYACV